MPGTDEYALRLDRVDKRFHVGKRTVEALRGVDLKVRHGAVTGLIGPDGAGKTTLMRLAAGLLRADAGKVSVLGLDADRDALQVQSSIGYMPQRFGLYEDLTVQENLDLYANLQGLPNQARAPRYKELMHMTGLGPFTARLAGRLSGGMKQKLGPPAPWCVRRACCCSTNRRWESTRSPAASCGPSSTGWCRRNR